MAHVQQKRFISLVLRLACLLLLDLQPTCMYITVVVVSFHFASKMNTQQSSIGIANLKNGVERVVEADREKEQDVRWCTI